MDKKKCMKCGELKPLSDFYRHPMMKDGHLNKCKECAKRDVRSNYQKNREYYLAYEKTEKRAESRRKRSKEALRKFRVNNPLKDKAHRVLNYHIRAGNIERPNMCSKCGKECVPDGHHENYSKPLEVVWLCRQCHIEHHRERKDK